MSFGIFSIFWAIGLTAILLLNVRRYIFWNVPVYLAGGILFGCTAIMAAFLHRGALANAFGAGAVLAMIIMAVGAGGIPPRMPQRK